MYRNDFNNWRRANSLRECVLSELQKVESFSREWFNHPIFALCGSPLNKLGFSIYEIPKSTWREWERTDDNYESEVAIIIAHPTTPEQCVSEIHYHNGDVLITGLGKTFGFDNPQGALLRGKLEWETIMSAKASVFMEHYEFEDSKVYPIQSLEPHGTFVELNTVTAFLAVTCGQRFNYDGELEGTGDIEPERCFVFDESIGENVALSSYIPYEKS